MNSDFWRDQRVFLTGHTGFKGGWLSLWLQQMGAEVFGFALEPTTSPSLFEVARVSQGMCSVIGDVRDLGALQKAINEARPSVVIHLAAQPLVVYSYANPVDTFAINVMGTVHLLEAVRNCKSVRAVVNVTTDKCYENKEWLWPYRETDRLGGYDPYSNSKACSELVTSSFRSSFFDENDYTSHGVGMATARAGNVIGGGDWSENRLIPDILRAFESGELVRVRNPLAIRPWQHVLEPLRGYLTLAEKLFEYGPQFAQSWNFGPQQIDAKSVGAIVESMCNKWGANVGWVHDGAKHPHEANYLKLDISQAAEHLDWKPGIDLEQALLMIVEWHRAFLANQDMRQYTLYQISNYQMLIEA
jgi:CDP-glucose 4,6-dehydratase